jgi:hypothetical protein
MKKGYVVVLVLLLPLLLMAVKLADYTFPETFYQESYLSGNFSLNNGNQEQSSYSGSFDGDYDIFYGSLPFSWRLGVDGNVDFSQGPNDGDESENGYGISATTNADKYLGDSKLFGYGSFDFGYRKSIGLDDADDPYAKVGLGMGFGRIIDATVLAKAMRIVEDLNKYTVLKGNLSDSSYLELAKIIDKENEYIATHGIVEYKKYWFEDMEKILLESGKLRDSSLGALGLIRIQEVLEESYGVRTHGWTVRGGAGFILSNYDGGESDPSIDLSFEYALPYSYRMQINERLDYSSILTDNMVHQFTNNLSLTYEVSNKIDWENGITTIITVPTAENSEKIITNSLISAVHYYIANQITADTSISLNHVNDGMDNNGNDDMSTSIFMGLTYRLR